MKTAFPQELEAARLPDYFGIPGGRNGRFRVQGPCGSALHVLCSDGMDNGWEQVSVSTDRRRCPNWLEMCFVKDLFWDQEECVVQYHPPASQYVKNNRYCLHLWKPTNGALPAPPSNLVGIVGVGPEESERAIEAYLRQLMERAA